MICNVIGTQSQRRSSRADSRGTTHWSTIISSARIPENEDARQAALDSYAILDTDSDPAYDAFAQLAAEICDTPMALVSLVDTSRQWFKANVGLPGVSETSREVAFCAHAVESREMLEVCDAQLDPRFADNPLVLGDPNIRFYAGTPLIDADGFTLGTLCALDRRPRTLTDRQRAALRNVASGLTSLIEARRGLSPDGLLQLSLLTTALASAPDPIAIVRIREPGRPTMFTYANRAFTDLFGYSLPELVGRPTSKLAGPRSDRSKTTRLQEAADRGEPGTEIVTAYSSAGVALTVEVRARSINATHRIVSFRDLTRLMQTQEALNATNQRLSSLLAHNNDAVLSVDRTGKCVDANAAAEEMFGYSRAEFYGFDLTKLRGAVFGGDDPFPNVFASGTTFEFPMTYRHRDGRDLRFECKAVPMIARGIVEGAFVIVKDVTERRRMSDLVAEHAKRTHALYLISATKAAADAEQIDAALELGRQSLGMDTAFVGAVRDGLLVIKNTVGEGLYPVGTALDLAHTHVSRLFESGDVLSFEDIADPVNERPGVPKYPDWHGYIAAPVAVINERSGVVGLLSRQPKTFGDFDVQFVRLVASLVSTLLERQTQQHRLDRLAYYDNLTGIPNRANFMRTLAASIERATAESLPFALHCIDLDGFKHLNDVAGHPVGDLALKEVGRRLANLVRSSDLPARLGGDEFVLLQGDVAQASDVLGLGGRIVRALSRPYDFGGVSYAMTASVGVATFPADGADAQTLLHVADAALYRAKQGGKNRVEFC